MQDAPPVQRGQGLKDQDRIFQNLYGRHGTDLKSAMAYGDWHRTKDIMAKGHDWVRIGQETALAYTDTKQRADPVNRSSQKSRHPASEVVAVLVSPPA